MKSRFSVVRQMQNSENWRAKTEKCIDFAKSDPAHSCRAEIIVGYWELRHRAISSILRTPRRAPPPRNMLMMFTAFHSPHCYGIECANQKASGLKLRGRRKRFTRCNHIVVSKADIKAAKAERPSHTRQFSWTHTQIRVLYSRAPVCHSISVRLFVLSIVMLCKLAKVKLEFIQQLARLAMRSR